MALIVFDEVDNNSLFNGLISLNLAVAFWAPLYSGTA